MTATDQSQSQTGNFYAALEAAFPAERSRPVIESENGELLTYADLEDWAHRLALALEGAGAYPGDRVAVQVEKSPLAVALYLACLKAGLIYLPLNPAYGGAETAHVIADAGPRLFICGSTRAPEAAALMGTDAAVLTLDDDGGGSLVEAASASHPPHRTVDVSGDQVAALLYTSGTTGRPKGAMITHANLDSNARALHALWGFGAGDVLIHALPIFHVHGLFVALHCVLLSGARALFLRRFDAARVVRLFARATVLMGVPTFYVRLLDVPELTPAACAQMRLFVSGSAPLAEETFRAFAARSGHAILERYGMTEAGIIASNPLHGARIAGTVGFPLPGVEARVVDEAGEAVAPGIPGQLEIRGPNLFAGYWQAPEKTRAEFRSDGFFRTGDLATLDETGRITIFGRARELIISGGFNVYPREVEAALDALPGVRESAVLGLPDREYGEVVAAAVVPDSAASAFTPGAIEAALATRLAGYKRPRRIVMVDALPRNAMGKVQKHLLRRCFEGRSKGMR